MTAASQWASVLGAVLLWLLLWWFSPALRQRELIEAPTTYWDVAGFAAISAIASVILSFVAIFFARLLFAPTALYWSERDRAEKIDQDLRVAKAENDAGPNRPIHKLFTHINLDLLSRRDDDVDKTWDQIGNDIRDQAALGHLRIWGRAVRNGLDLILGQRETLRLIEPSYWTTAFFTYSFFDNTAGDAPQTYLQTGHSGVEYTDLRVSGAEILSIWPPSYQRALRIVLDHLGEFETRKSAGLYSTDHAFSVCVENAHPTKFLSNCKLYLNIANPKDGERNYIRPDGGALRWVKCGKIGSGNCPTLC